MEVPVLLEGIRVLDLTDESGVLAPRLLADLGADVIRIEAPGDVVRTRGPFLDGVDGVERSLSHLHYNRNKRSIVLRLADPGDRQILENLVQSADAVIESARPGEMDALGLGYESLCRINPHLIYTTVTPFGQTGPFRDYAANDLVASAASGLLYLNGFPDDPPNLPGGEQAYKIGSLVAAAGTAMALVGRQNDRRARGRRVDVSLQEASAMATLQMANANALVWHGQVPRRVGGTVHRTRDGKWMTLFPRVGSQDTFGKLAEWLADEQIDTPITGEAWLDQTYQLQRRELVQDAVAKLCAKLDLAELFHEGQRREQMAMPVYDVADLVADQQLAHRQFFVRIPTGDGERELIDSGLPYRVGNVDTRPHRRAPHLDEHREEILAQIASNGVASAERDEPGDEPFDPARPLKGIRIADLTWMIAGPASTRMLADFGATVMKIESESRIDNMRILGIHPDSQQNIDTNPVFNDCNTNKLSLRLNINHPDGFETLKKVIAESDVVINNFSGDRMARWGLGYEDVKKIKDDIIYVSMPVMGTTGPYRNYGAYGTGVVAFSGLNMATGFPERDPIGLGPLYSDFSSPYLLVTATMAALHHRNKTGQGVNLDISQAECTISLLGPDILGFTANGTLPARMGNRAPSYAPHGVYPCAGDDRWCAIAAGSDAEWTALANVIGPAALANDARFLTHEARKANEDELDGIVGQWTRERDAWDLMHLLQAEGVAAAVVEDLADMVERDPGLSVQHFVRVPFPEEGVEFRTHGQPLRMNGVAAQLRRAPRLGEHSEQILKEVAGLSEADIEELLIAGAIY